MQPARWLQSTTPLPRLPGSPTPFKLLFGRDVRSQIDAVTPELDGSDFLQHGGIHNFVADRKEAWREVAKVRDALLKRHEIRQHQRSRRNAGIQRASAGTKVKGGGSGDGARSGLDTLARRRAPQTCTRKMDRTVKGFRHSHPRLVLSRRSLR